MNKHQLVKGILLGATMAVIFAVIITIAGELYKVVGIDGKSLNPIKDLLKEWHGHHWVGKGIWAAIVFGVTILTSYTLSKKDFSEVSLNKYVSLLTYSVSLGTILLFVFFGYEYMIH
ncbi:MAG: hypothetical protein K9M10_00930 [Candidatus Pacebacteria bacterium]|nr:hypothetical protein [Candidatus Paceibacterota bacterium]MCF7857027.1 hypothetical protein [Candidatus Paceibacterota bacterium]